MKESYCIRWAGEIWTKSEKTKKRAIKLLIKNLKLKKGEYLLLRERLFIFKENYEEKIAKTFGISSWSKGFIVEKDIDKISEIAINLLRSKKISTFKIDTHRIDKSYQYTSLEINKYIGEKVVKTLGLKVDLENPECTIYIEILKDFAFVTDNWNKGLGGLPYGFSGKVVALISGGIDSVVAAWLMMKRGCRIIPLHFYITEEGLEKFEELIEILREYGSMPDPIIVNQKDWLEDVKNILKKHNALRYICVLCKRRMIKKACEYCEKYHANAIVTGDSLGQVASQTLKNIYCISEISSYPILRPLIGLDKEEIIQLAKKIGTYKISIKKKDICPYVPKHPIINPDIKKVKQIEEIIAKELGEF